MMHIKEPLLLIGKSSPWGDSRFPFLLSEWSFTICPTPFNTCNTTCSILPIYCGIQASRKEGNVLWLYGIRHMVKETCCHHMGYSFRLTARVLLYAPSHRQDSTYHSLCYTLVMEHWLEREIAQGFNMKDRSDGPSHHEWTLLPLSYISFPRQVDSVRLYHRFSNTTVISALRLFLHWHWYHQLNWNNYNNTTSPMSIKSTSSVNYWAFSYLEKM